MNEREVQHLTLTFELTKTKWGEFIVWDSGQDYKLKTLSVKPHTCLSLQRHKERSEWWFVIRGKATIRYPDGGTRILEKSKFMYTPHMNWHQICNEEDEDLEIIEIQFGNCVEEDVERK